MCRRASGHSAVSWRINGTNREEKRRTLMEGEELVQRILQVDLNKSLTGAEFITINLSRQQRSRGVWHVAYVTERNRRYRRRRSSPSCPSDQFHAVIVLPDSSNSIFRVKPSAVCSACSCVCFLLFSVLCAFFLNQAEEVRERS